VRATAAVPTRDTARGPVVARGAIWRRPWRRRSAPVEIRSPRVHCVPVLICLSLDGGGGAPSTDQGPRERSPAHAGQLSQQTTTA